ncbi:MAG: beta-glucosidase family protein [Solirubrobacteraceae bacterium]
MKSCRALPLLMTLLAVAVVAPSAGAAGRCGDPAQRPWCNTALSPDDRAQLLLAALTPDERIGLLGGDEVSGVAGGEGKHTGTQDGVPRVGFPTIYYSDGPQGPRQGKVTGMPSPMADAATWSPVTNRTYGRLVGDEVAKKGNDMVYAPTVNLLRTPLWGRAFETFGEDPYLTARTAVAWIDGAQSSGVMANVKHFALNNQEGRSACCADNVKPGDQLAAITPYPDLEGGRMNVNVTVDERTMRETELLAFEAAVKEANVASIMCSYNKVGGTYACENDHLLKGVLDGWGFKGFVLSDYLAAHDTGASLRGGLDFEPWPGFDVYGPVPVNAALLSGDATMADVDRHVRRMLRTFFAYGVLDRVAYADDTSSIPLEAHRKIAQRVEEQAIVLLKNRGRILPLRANRLKSVAVIGAGADTFITGGGSGNVTPFRYVSPRAAIEARVAKGTKVLVDDGSDAARAAGVAKQADVALVFAPVYTTEGVDRRCLSLECPPNFGDQDGLIRAVAAANRRTVVVLESPGPQLTPWRDKIGGLVEAWYPGQEGGTAIARVLFGDAEPGGRLPVTFPESEDQTPTAGDAEKYPGVGNEETYKEGVFVGHRWYDEHRLKPAFPFGFGLSYTTWKLDRLRVTGRTVTARVRNTGSRKGSTVAQLYLGLPSSAAVPQPPRTLKGYRKVALRPHHAKTVRFTLSDRDLAYWSADANGWRIAAGRYRVEVGFSSRSVKRAGTIRQATEAAAR